MQLHRAPWRGSFGPNRFWQKMRKNYDFEVLRRGWSHFPGGGLVGRLHEDLLGVVLGPHYFLKKVTFIVVLSIQKSR